MDVTVKDWKLNRLIELYKNGHTNKKVLAYALSVTIIERQLSNEFLSRIYGSNSNSYFYQPAVKKEELILHLDRILNLAEYLENNRKMAEFDELVHRLKNADIQSTAAELAFGSQCAQAGVAYNYIKPQQKKGQDYDVEIYSCGITIPTEIKCKLDGNEVTEKNLKRVVNRCREQLPKNKLGHIQLFLHREHFQKKLFEKVILNAFKSSRIGSIAFSTSSVGLKNNNGINSHAHVYEIKSNASSSYTNLIEKLYSSNQEEQGFNLAIFIDEHFGIIQLLSRY